MEEGEDPIPYIGDAGFHSYAQLPQIEAEPAHDTIPPLEVPFVPQSMLDDDFQLELPPPPARGPRQVQGEIRLPAKIREEIEQAERERTVIGHPEDQPLERMGDLIQPQSVESSSPTTHQQGELIPQLGGGGVPDIPIPITFNATT